MYKVSREAVGKEIALINIMLCLALSAMKTPLKIDISTDDVITPKEVD